LLLPKVNPLYVYLVIKIKKPHFDSLYLERAIILCLSVFTSPQVYIPPGQFPDDVTGIHTLEVRSEFL